MNFYQTEIEPRKIAIQEKHAIGHLHGKYSSFLYRGLESSDFGFVPSIERTAYTDILKRSDLFELEERLISVAKSKIEKENLSCHFNGFNAELSEQELFWSLYFELRHLGLPLSVQEWSTSIDMALFFATRPPKDESALAEYSKTDAKIGILEYVHTEYSTLNIRSLSRAEVNREIYVNYGGYDHKSTQNYKSEFGLSNMYLQSCKFIFQEKSRLLPSLEENYGITPIYIPADKKASVYESACKNLPYKSEMIEQNNPAIKQIIKETIAEVFEII